MGHEAGFDDEGHLPRGAEPGDARWVAGTALLAVVTLLAVVVLVGWIYVCLDTISWAGWRGNDDPSKGSRVLLVAAILPGTVAGSLVLSLRRRWTRRPWADP